MTAVYVYVDVAHGILRHASAGHPPALLWRPGEASAVALGDGGPLIASVAPREYPLAEVTIAPGDRVLLYTDCVVEAMRADGAMFGQDRLRTLVAEAPADPEALVTKVVDEVAAFTGRRGREFEDDLTLVAVAVGG